MPSNAIERFPLRYRLLGLLPLTLFAARLVELNSRGETAHILWVCHISNLLLALGLFCGCSEPVRVATLWLMIGSPLWLVDINRTGIMQLTSVGTHYVGLVIGLAVMKRLGAGKSTWLYALAWFMALRQLAYVSAPADFNVNLAHAIYPGWEVFFSAYWQYWIFTTLSAAAGLWLLARALTWVFSAGRAS